VLEVLEVEAERADVVDRMVDERLLDFSYFGADRGALPVVEGGGSLRLFASW
jgi:hypothetical protein